MQARVLSQHLGAKVMCPGRVVILETKCHNFALAVVLQITGKDFKLLALCEQNAASSTMAVDDDWSILPRSVVARRLFKPEGQCGHCVIAAGADDIAVVTPKILKISADKIVDDVRKREQPRFRFGTLKLRLSVVS